MNIPSQHFQPTYEGVVYTAENIGRQTGKLIGKTYTLMQTQQGSYLTVIVANIISFEIALKICRLINTYFCQFKEDEVEENQQQRWKLTLLFISIVGGSITGCCKTLNLPLSFWKVTGVSFVTGIVYLFHKTC